MTDSNEGPKRPHVLIVGAGIGGLTLTQLLRKRNISYEIFERDPEPRTTGWCIALHTMLEELQASFPDDVPSLEEADHLKPLKLPSQSVIYPSNDPDVRFGTTAAGSNDFLRCNREKLRQVLVTNVNVHMSKKCSRVEESSEGVTVHFEDGTSATGDIVVGADGVNSIVRSHLLTSDPLEHLPLGVIGGELSLGGRYMERQLELGHSTYTVFLKDDAEDTNSGNFVTLFAALERVHPDGNSADFYWILTWRDEKAGKEDFWTKHASQQELYDFVQKATKALNTEFRRTIDATSVDRILGNPFPLRTLITPGLPSSRATLLGDAAHCMPPFGGQGGVQAIIDALNLAKAIGNLPGQVVAGEEIKEALSSYNEEMLQRGNDAVRKSLAVYDPNAKKFAWDRAPETLPKENISLEKLRSGIP